jgi:hypothetical protein
VGLFEKVDSLENKLLKIPSISNNSSFPAELPVELVSPPLTTANAPVTVPSVSDRPLPAISPSLLHDCTSLPSFPDFQKAPTSSFRAASYGRKEWKSNRRTKRMVLGDGVGLEDLCKMSLCALVGRISYKSLSTHPLEDWIKLHWYPLLGYSPEVLYLKKGWLGFNCKSPEDASLLLNTLWVFGGSSLMLKRWRMAFNPDTDYFQHRHLWVLLLGPSSLSLERRSPSSYR